MPEGCEPVAVGYWSDVELLLIPLVLGCAFALPFLLALLEPQAKEAPSHRAQVRRTSLR